MKVLTLWQPWATLVVIGAKKIETRSFNTKYRGPILIHASKVMKPEHKILARSEPFWSKLKHLEELPLGVIIGKVDIGETYHTGWLREAQFEKGRFSNIRWKEELLFGDYSHGRMGWLLENPISFSHQIPFIGGVGLTKSFDDRICLGCGCMDHDCHMCIKKTGKPCFWVQENLCSACQQ